MKCGVKFCGGCNPRYDRGQAYRDIKDELPTIDFEYAEEGKQYDNLLVIGGCTACCASYKQYDVRNKVLKMCSEEHKQKIIKELAELQAE